jgi:hypothetical protein
MGEQAISKQVQMIPPLVHRKPESLCLSWEDLRGELRPAHRYSHSALAVHGLKAVHRDRKRLMLLSITKPLSENVSKLDTTLNIISSDLKDRNDCK